jgi:hypothetical protein
MVPGRALHRVAARICSERSLERVVEPAIADLQKEYGGVTAGHSFLRAWTLVRGYSSLLQVLAVCTLSMQTETDDERSMLTQTLAWSVAFVVASAALLILPPLSNYGNGVRGWYVAMTLVPQAVPLAIPIGIAFGFAIGATGRKALRASTVLLLVATVASLLSFVMLAWGMPAGNEAFREIAFRQVRAQGHEGQAILQKGHNEMTLSELRRELAVLSDASQPRQARQFAFSLHLRFSLAAATLALASVLLAVRTRRRGFRVLIAVASCLAYWMLLYAGDTANRRGYVTPPIAAWLPNLVMIASAMFIVSSRSSRLRGSSLRGSVIESSD